MPKISGNSVDFWSAEDTIYAGCPVCGRTINWVHSRSRLKIMNGSCCGYTHEAFPIFPSGGGITFHITSKQLDMQNVIAFPPLRDHRLPSKDS